MKTKILLFVILICSVTVMAQKKFENTNLIKPNDGMVFDLRSLNWINAYDSLHIIIQEPYPFTEWKGIDWDQKSTFTKPKIQKAPSSDVVKLSGTLFEYLYSVQF